MSDLTRVVLKATREDLQNIAIIATLMRDQGESFATRTDALRHALKTVAATAAAPKTPTA